MTIISWLVTESTSVAVVIRGNYNVLETQLNKRHSPVSVCIWTKLFSYLQILLLCDEACRLYNYIWPSFISVLGNENILPPAIEHRTCNYIIMCDLMYLFSVSSFSFNLLLYFTSPISHLKVHPSPDYRYHHRIFKYTPKPKTLSYFA